MMRARHDTLINLKCRILLSLQRMTPSDRTDSELLDQLKSGDRRAFSTIYDRYCSSLYHTAIKILNDSDLAKDVVQDTFIMLFEKADKRMILNLQAYLFQTVKYRCFMHLRSGRISQKHLQLMNLIIASNELEEELDAKELQSLLDESIATLPQRCREVFYLSRFECLPNREIASRLKISNKTVENQITKALKILHTSVDKIALAIFFTGL
jgi:RNA polymerase sigma-70 factor (ECF subfamily)